MTGQVEMFAAGQVKAPKYSDVVIRSSDDDQDRILGGIIKLHHAEGFDADLTYGNGCFWRALPAPALKFDIDPQVAGVVKASSTNLPLADDSLSCVAFDPPFLTYVAGGREHKDGSVAMTSRFGGYWTYDELLDHYTKTIKECRRVIRNKGLLVFKCQDIIHNHKMQCTHNNVINMAAACGFSLVDLFVLNAKHRMEGPQAGKQRHARVFHSYFLVFMNVKRRA